MQPNDPDMIREKGHSVANAATQIEEICAELLRQCALVATSWNTEDEHAYRDLTTRCESACADLIDTLNTCAQALFQNANVIEEENMGQVRCCFTPEDMRVIDAYMAAKKRKRRPIVIRYDPDERASILDN